MASILLFGKYGKKESLENPITRLYNWYTSLDFFYRLTIIIVLLITIGIPFVIYNNQIFKPRASSNLPPDGFGLYESCSPVYDSQYRGYCNSRLVQMSQAGFKLVLNYDALSNNSTASQIESYGNEANSLGMKVIWGIGNNKQFFDGSNLLTACM